MDGAPPTATTHAPQRQQQDVRMDLRVPVGAQVCVRVRGLLRVRVRAHARVCWVGSSTSAVTGSLDRNRSGGKTSTRGSRPEARHPVVPGCLRSLRVRPRSVHLEKSRGQDAYAVSGTRVGAERGGVERGATTNDQSLTGLLMTFGASSSSAFGFRRPRREPACRLGQRSTCVGRHGVKVATPRTQWM